MRVNEGAIYLLSFYVSHNVHTIEAIIVLYKICHFDDSLKLCHSLNPHIFTLIMLNKLGLIATKPVFRVSDKARFKPVSPATETILQIEISPVARTLRCDTFQKTNNKGAEQAARMPRLVCAFVVRKH